MINVNRDQAKIGAEIPTTIDRQVGQLYEEIFKHTTSDP